MLKKTVTYEDLEGKTVTEDLYFNLSKSELIDMELGTEGGFEDRIKKLMSSANPMQIVQEFKKIVVDAYGVKSDDGKRFVKGPEQREAFEQSLAFDALFFTLATDQEATIEFVNGLIPKDLAELVEKMGENNAASAETVVELPETKKPSEMSRDELLAAFNEKVKNTQQ